MSHQFVSGWGKTPMWHQLGSVIPEGIHNSKDALIAAGADYNVIEKPIIHEYIVDENAGIEGLKRDKIPYKMLVHEKTNKVLHVTTSKYSVLQNTQAFSFFDPLLEEDALQFEACTVLKNGAVVTITAKLNIPSYMLLPDLEIRPYILLANSHDGSLPVTVQFTPIVVVCANTLAASLSTSKEDLEEGRLLRVRHVGNVNQKLEQVREFVNIYQSKFDISMQEYKILASREMSFDVFKEYLGKVFDKDEIEDSQHWSKLEELYNNGLGSDNKPLVGTLFWGYMVLTEYTSYYSRAKSDSNRLYSNWYGANANLRKKGLDIALRISKNLKSFDNTISY